MVKYLLLLTSIGLFSCASQTAYTWQDMHEHLGKSQTWTSKSAELMLPDNTSQAHQQESPTSETAIRKMILWQRTRWANGDLTVTPQLQSTSTQSRFMMSPPNTPVTRERSTITLNIWTIFWRSACLIEAGNIDLRPEKVISNQWLRNDVKDALRREPNIKYKKTHTIKV